MIGKKDKFLRLSKSIISTKEIFAVKNILKRGFLGMGPEVKKFENNLKDYLGRDVVCFNSGTAALQISLQACGIGQGHEVLVPSITYVASFQAISATGAVPVSCDIDMENMQISLINLKKEFPTKQKLLCLCILPDHHHNYQRFINLRKIIN